MIELIQLFLSFVNYLIGFLWQFYLWTAGLNILAIVIVSVACRIWGPSTKYHYHLKFTLVFLVIWGSGMVLWPLYAFRPNNGRNFIFTNWFYKLATPALDISTEIRDGHKMKNDKGAVIVPNHQSALDTILHFFVSPYAGKVAPIAKKELLYVVPMGFFSWLAGMRFVDRSSPAKAYKTLENCVAAMKRDNFKLVIYPEGTRNRGPGFLPFKKGAFKTAIMGQVPIIPMVASPYYFIDHEKRQFRPGKVIIRVLDPIPTKGMVNEDWVRLMDKTREVMLKEYERLATEVGSIKEQ